MNTEPQIYDFQEQLKIGKQAEAYLDSKFSSHYEIKKVSLETEKKFGFDRLFYENLPGALSSMFSVEYKTDLKALETGNLFIETEIISGAKISRGWALRSLAQYFLFFIPQVGRCLIVPASFIKEGIPNWLESFEAKCCQNDGYNGKGVLVPVEVFTQSPLVKEKEIDAMIF